MAVYALHGTAPRLGSGVFVADTAAIIGDVWLGDGASVWFGAVLRGDCYPIRIGARTNVQDNAVVHVTGGEASTTVGDDVTIGHSAVVHGCTVGDRCLIGIGTVILDGAVIGDDSLVAAGSLVTPGTRVPPKSLLMGRPARVVRPAGEADFARIAQGAQNYLAYARDFVATAKRIG
ncbi:MAG TPA: gamma carbonic anhydrase family protein [Polyangiaceae bacterium]|jgi:carbonic anhydrase/acetyltransferase-like protein (isoleucine patch superfamily)